jgi:uncharacterized membrane protein YhaH (DUF805 family)
MVVGLLSYVSPYAKGADDASGSVENAKFAVGQAFNAASDAERAGANVSGLIVRLNEAGAVLVEAEIALGDGNSGEAFSRAGQCVGIAESVRTEAVALKTSTLDKAQTIFWMYLTFSVVSIAVFVSVLVLVWRRLKRGQVEKTLSMKFEVAHDEA